MNCTQRLAFDFEDIFGFAIAVLNLLLISLVLFISFRLKSNEISRIYTIFLFLSYVPAEVLSLLYDSLRCAGLVDMKVTYYPEINWLYFFYKLSRNIAQTQYELLALVMAFMSYLLFTNPAKFNLYFRDGQALWYLSGISLLSVLTSALGIFLSIVDLRENVILEVVYGVLYFTVQATIVGPFALMVFFYVMSCIAIRHYSKTSNHVRAEQDRRSQLVSVLVYCTPPNILNIVVIVICICQVISFFTSTYPPFYSCIRTVQWYNEKLRLIFLTFCTLFAFGNYRNFVVAMCFHKRGTEVLVINSIHTTRTDSANGAARRTYIEEAIIPEQKPRQ
ncbi:hypothetical protein QR680_008732 [Steinernema hermaphroditum]|uniref:Uncharacterized protein n=1 Tax=Steinernema hermaphroditum TaxID=289476 RepID=A0AA39M8L6_9BILA|nr:hypothetical protein QR680_008732 [Steinernema hermaphroditum]